MIITKAQSAGIREFVHYLGGNPELVEEAVEDLGSPEIIGRAPGPTICYLSPQEQRALTVIQNNITGPDCSMPVTQACKVLEEVVCRNMEPEDLTKYLQNLDQSFARNSIPFGKVLFSSIRNNLTPILVTFFGLFVTSLFAFTQHKSNQADERPSFHKPYPETQLKSPSNTYPSFRDPNIIQYPELRDYKPTIYIHSQEKFPDKKKEKKESPP